MASAIGSSRTGSGCGVGMCASLALPFTIGAGDASGSVDGCFASDVGALSGVGGASPSLVVRTEDVVGVYYAYRYLSVPA